MNSILETGVYVHFLKSVSFNHNHNILVADEKTLTIVTLVVLEKNSQSVMSFIYEDLFVGPKIRINIGLYLEVIP